MEDRAAQGKQGTGHSVPVTPVPSASYSLSPQSVRTRALFCPTLPTPCHRLLAADHQPTLVRRCKQTADATLAARHQGQCLRYRAWADLS